MAVRLSLMMFLQHFILGAWYVTVGNFMAEAGMVDVIFWAYTVGPLAAVISPFFLGFVADRFFATEKVIGVLSVLGAGAMVGAARVGGNDPVLFILFLLLHTLCYFPTLGLSNTLAFHHIADRKRQYPVIRAFGTIGWVVAGILVSGLLTADKTVIPLQCAAGMSLIYGLYSFTLPYTPPPAKAEPLSLRHLLGINALHQLKSRSFFVFILCAALISIPLAAYNAYAPVFLSAVDLSSPAVMMSFGQMAEVLVMVAMPLFFARMSFKAMFLAGLAAWGLRYLLFAAAIPASSVAMIMAGILLHGFCFNFVFISSRVYIDEKATPSIRGQAQGFIVVITLGLGQLLGAPAMGWLFNHLLETPTATSAMWPVFWLVPAVFSFLVMGLFGWLFEED